MAVALGVVLQWVSLPMGETARPYTEGAGFGAGSVPEGDSLLMASGVPVSVETPAQEVQDIPRLGSQEPHYFPPTLYPTVIPTLAPPPTPVAQAASVSGQLTEAEMRALLAEAGWEDALIPEALAVFCGINNRSGHPRGESGCNPGAVGDSGNSLGLGQLNGDTWAPYCGVPREALMDALTNLRCARKVYQYDIDRGYARWKQWTVKP